MSQEILNKLNAIELGQARLETKMDTVLEHKIDHEKRVRTLEKKWYTSIGAVFIAITTAIINGIKFLFS